MIWILIAIICGSVALDQLTKWITIFFLKPVDTIPLWEGVFHLSYVENRGAAFGILQNARWVFIVATIIIIALLIAYYIIQKEKSNPQNY